LKLITEIRPGGLGGSKVGLEKIPARAAKIVVKLIAEPKREAFLTLHTTL
jgi:hypothetical protein